MGLIYSFSGLFAALALLSTTCYSHDAVDAAVKAAMIQTGVQGYIDKVPVYAQERLKLAKVDREVGLALAVYQVVRTKSVRISKNLRVSLFRVDLVLDF
jgi:hypothetical protein